MRIKKTERKTKRAKNCKPRGTTNIHPAGPKKKKKEKEKATNPPQRFGWCRPTLALASDPSRVSWDLNDGIIQLNVHFDSQFAWLTEAISFAFFFARSTPWLVWNIPRPDSDRPRMFVFAGKIATSAPYYKSFLSLFVCVSHCTCITQWIEMKQALSTL